MLLSFCGFIGICIFEIFRASPIHWKNHSNKQQVACFAFRTKRYIHTVFLQHPYLIRDFNPWRMRWKLHYSQDGINPLFSSVVAQYSVMPHLYKTFGQNVLLKTPDKLMQRQYHRFHSFMVGIVLIPKTDTVFGNFQNAVI